MIKRMTNFKTRIKLWIDTKKVRKVIQFNQKARLKRYNDMNTKLGVESKNEFEKYFFKLKLNVAFGKIIENVTKQRYIKFVIIERMINYLASEPNYHMTKSFSENLLAIEMKKIKVKMNKIVYLGLSMLEVNKTLMYECWYNYIQPKYQYNAKLCYMDTDSFIIHNKTKDVYEDIPGDIEKRFDASICEFTRSLPKCKTIKVKKK